MKTFDALIGKKIVADVFDLFTINTLTDVEMNYVRGGGDPPMDGEPDDILFPFPRKPKP